MGHTIYPNPIIVVKLSDRLIPSDGSWSWKRRSWHHEQSFSFTKRTNHRQEHETKHHRSIIIHHSCNIVCLQLWIAPFWWTHRICKNSCICNIDIIGITKKLSSKKWTQISIPSPIIHKQSISNGNITFFVQILPGFNTSLIICY